MTTESIAVRDGGQVEMADARTARDIQARVLRIQEVVKSVMVEGEHFGIIPGCKKRSLYKSGAELLLMTFQVANKVAQVEDLSTPDEIRYRVTVAGVSQVTGAFLGDHVGECSSSEEKYKWQKPVCNEEWDETPVDRRRETWKHGREGKAYKVKQIRTTPADVANTVLSMSEKRGMVGMTRSVTGASSMFTDGIEDLPPGMEMDDGDKRPPIKPPQAKAEAGPVISEPQRVRMFAIAGKANVTDEGLRLYLRGMGIEHTKDIPKSKYESICAWAFSGGQTPPEQGQ